MDEYIEREAVLNETQEINHWCGYEYRYENFIPVNAVLDIPVADVAPVRHGRWDRVKNPQWPAYSHDKCSLCGWWNTKNALCYEGGRKPGHSLNFCPNCGAKMDLEEKI